MGLGWGTAWREGSNVGGVRALFISSGRGLVFFGLGVGVGVGAGRGRRRHGFRVGCHCCGVGQARRYICLRESLQSRGKKREELRLGGRQRYKYNGPWRLVAGER